MKSPEYMKLKRKEREEKIVRRNGRVYVVRKKNPKHELRKSDK